MFTSRDESVFVVSNLWPAFVAQYDGDDVEAERTIFDGVRGEEAASGPEHSGLLGRSHGRLGGTEVLVRPGLDLDKDEGSIGIDHYQIDLTGLAAKIARERLEALVFEKSFTTFLAPSTEQSFIRQQTTFIP
jgi:hypothetical protein